MSKENLVEENAAVDAATNEDDNTHVTSRKYKITVCVIAVLLAIAFLVKWGYHPLSSGGLMKERAI